MLEKLGQQSLTAAGKLHVRSALNPLLWLTAISSPVCFGAGYLFQENSLLSGILVGVGVFPIIVACLGFCYFACKKPEKLQSEDYQIRHESLQLIQQKSGDIEIPTASLEQIVNPSMQNIESKGDQK